MYWKVRHIYKIIIIYILYIYKMNRRVKVGRPSTVSRGTRVPYI